MPLNTNDHASEEVLEQYALGSLEEPLLGEIEEHLLLCSQCQEQLKEIDAYHAAMRGAAVRLDTEDEQRKRLWTRISGWLTVSRLGWALALGAVLVLALSTRVWMRRPPAGSPLAIYLDANRGAEVRHAASGRPLELTLDTTALSRYPVYRAETVDVTGNIRAQSDTTAAEGKVKVSLSQGLTPGSYFVRLYSPSHELLREYGLMVE